MIGGSNNMDIQIKGLKGHIATINFQQGEYQIEAQDANLVYKNKKALRVKKIYNFDTGGSDEYTVKGHKFTLVQDSNSQESNNNKKKKKENFDEYGPTIPIQDQEGEDTIEDEKLQIGKKNKSTPEKISKPRNIKQVNPTIIIQQNIDDQEDFQIPQPKKMQSFIRSKVNKPKFDQYATTLAIQNDDDDDDNNDQKDEDGFAVPFLKPSINKKKTQNKKVVQFKETQAIIDNDDDDDDGDDDEQTKASTMKKNKQKPKVKFNQFATTLAIVDDDDDDDDDDNNQKEDKSSEKMNVQSNKSKNFNQYATTLAINDQQQQEQFLAPVNKKKQKKISSSKKFSEFAATISINQGSDDEDGDRGKQQNKLKQLVVPAKKSNYSQFAPTIAIQAEEQEEDIEKNKPNHKNQIKETKNQNQKKAVSKKKSINKKTGNNSLLDDPDSLVNDIFGIEQEQQAQPVKENSTKLKEKPSKPKEKKIIQSSQSDSDAQVNKKTQPVKRQDSKKILSKSQSFSSQSQSQGSAYKKVGKGKKNKEPDNDSDQDKDNSAEQIKQQNQSRNLRDSKLRITISGLKKTRKMLNMVSKIGAKLVVDSVQDFDVVLVQKPQKTVKVIIAAAKGLPVISLDWLQASVNAKKQLDFQDYFLDWSEHLENKQQNLALKKFKLFKNDESVYIHQYLKDEDKKDVAGLVDDFKHIIKLVGGNVTISSTKADICIFPPHFKSQKKIEGRRIEIGQLREAILNQRQIQF